MYDDTISRQDVCDDGPIYLNKYSDRVTIVELTEIDGMPIFDVFDFPAEEEQPPIIDLQGTSISTPSAPPASSIDIEIETDELLNLPDFE